MSKKILVGALALVVGVVLGAVFGARSSSLGGLVHISEEKFVQGLKAGTTDQFSVSNAGVLTTTGSLKVGANGSTMAEIKAATCDMYIGGGSTVSASSTVTRTCVVTGVTSADVVFAQFPTSTANGAGWVIVGATPMTDAVSIQVANLSGVTAVIPAALASSTRILYIDN